MITSPKSSKLSRMNVYATYILFWFMPMISSQSKDKLHSSRERSLKPRYM